MTWFSIAVPLIIATALLVIPGVVVGYAAGVRRILLLGLAPLISMTVLVVAATASPFLHVRWGIIPALATTVGLAVLVWLIRWLIAKKWPQAVATRWVGPGASESFSDPDRGYVKWFVFAVVIAAVIIGVRFAYMMGEPGNISQTYDNNFHLNAIRYVLDTGNASSLTLGGLNLNHLTRSGFYPAGWHALTSLTVSLSHSTIPIGVNAVSLALGAVAWPLGAVLLARVVLGARKLVFVSSGILAGAFAAFPYLMVDFGILYAFALGLTLLAPGIALAVIAFGHQRTMALSRGLAILLLLLAAPGLTLTHTSVLLALIAIGGPLVLLVLIARHRQMRAGGAAKREYVIMYLLALALLVVVGVLFYVFSPSNMWHPKKTLPEAFGEFALWGPVGLSAALVLALFVTVGVVVAIRKRVHTWLLLTFLLFAILFLAGEAMPANALRNVLIGVWYGDVYRTASMLAIVSVPLAVLGMVATIDYLSGLVHTRGWRISRQTSIVILLLLALIGTQVSNVNEESQRGRADYALTPTSPLISTDEMALLNEVDKYVPAGVTVAGNPWAGASLVYAIANRPALLMHIKFDTPLTNLITHNLQDAATNPAVCEAIKKTNTGYVLDFPGREIFGQTHIYEGLTNLDKNPSVAFVTKVGDASLWKITACQ